MGLFTCAWLRGCGHVDVITIMLAWSRGRRRGANGHASMVTVEVVMWEWSRWAWSRGRDHVDVVT